MWEGKSAKAVLLLAAVLALCVADPAWAKNKKHGKGTTKEGGIFVAPSPLPRPPAVLEALGTEPREVKVDYAVDPDPPATATGGPAETAKDAPYGVAALRIHSLFE